MTIELKPVPDEDLEAFTHMMADPSLSINTGSVPTGVDMEWSRVRLETRRLEELAGKRVDRGIYAGDTLVGTAGWFYNEDDKMEIGYAIHKDHRGKGFATDAAGLVLDLLRADGFKEPVYAQYFKDNEASGRVLEKLGFSRVGSVESISAARGGSSPAWVMRLDGLCEGEKG